MKCITLAWNVDCSSNSQAFGIGAVDGATVSLTVRATDDQLVEGPESFAAAALVDTTSNAAGTEAGAGTGDVSDNDSATGTPSGATTAGGRGTTRGPTA